MSWSKRVASWLLVCHGLTRVASWYVVVEENGFLYAGRREWLLGFLYVVGRREWLLGVLVGDSGFLYPGRREWLLGFLMFRKSKKVAFRGVGGEWAKRMASCVSCSESVISWNRGWERNLCISWKETYL